MTEMEGLENDQSGLGEDQAAPMVDNAALAAAALPSATTWFAVVRANGTFFTYVHENGQTLARAHMATFAQRLSTGRYLVHFLGRVDRAACIATVGNWDSNVLAGNEQLIFVNQWEQSGSAVYVAIRNSRTQAYEDHAFHLAVHSFL